MINTCIKLFDLTAASNDWGVAGDWLEDHGHPVAHSVRVRKYCLFERPSGAGYGMGYAAYGTGSGSGFGTGSGTGYGVGYGSGPGVGYGSGYDFGSGSGDGSGAGHGDGCGASYGNGWGTGVGYVEVQDAGGE